MAYGNSQWVAVGEVGTILTSPDGVTWTRRDSGFPDRWLTGVAYAAGTWVVVGGTAPSSDSKAVILTSADAVTWTPRLTTGTRLNNAVYGNGMFVAVDDKGNSRTSPDGMNWGYIYSSSNYSRTDFLRGLAFGAPFFTTTGLSGIYSSGEGQYWTNLVPTAGQIEGAAYGRKQFVLAGANGATFTSRDGQTWTPQPTTSAMTFRGAAFFNNQFIAVGNSVTAGRGIASSFDGALWIERSTNVAAGANLLAVSAGPDSAIAVGEGGLILQSPAAANPPTVASQPIPVRESVGGNVAFAVVASGSLPLNYQWRKDGLDLPGATGDTLFLPAVRLADAGSYSCVITNAFGSILTNLAPLTVLDRNPAANPVDPTFALDTALSVAPRVAALQADGKILLGGSFTLFNQGRTQSGLARLNANGSLDSSFAPGLTAGTVTAIVPQPDGKILVGGNFTSIGGITRPGLARLNLDGSVDTTFVPARSPIGLSAQLLLDSTGRIVSTDGSVVFRLNPNGGMDNTWSLHPIETLADSGATSIFQVTCTVKRITQLPNGNFVALATTPPIQGFNPDPFSPPPPASSFSILELLDANGNDRNELVNETVPNDPLDLRITTDGSILIATSFALTNYLYSSSLLSNFTVSTGSLTCIAPTADGGFWLGGAFSNALSRTMDNVDAFVPRNQIVRVNADLSIAPFDPGLGLTDANGASVAPQCLLALPDGRAIVCGDFTRIDSIARSQVARLNAQSPTGFNSPAILDVRYQDTRDGEPFVVTARVTGSAPFSFPPSYTYDPASGSVSYLLSNHGLAGVRVANPVGASVPQYFFARAVPSLPVLTAQPASLQTNTGRFFTLGGLTVIGTTPVTYQWYRNGSPIVGATFATYSVSSATTADGGDYRVTVSNSIGSTSSAAVHVGVDETFRLVNVAVRGFAGRSDSPLIVGFVMQGPGNKRVLVRAVGPTLSSPPFNVPGALFDPFLNIYDSTGALVFSNDDWFRSTDAVNIRLTAAALGAFPLSASSLDSAGIVSLAPGAYTAVISGFPEQGVDPTGIALAEIYEDDTASSRLVNVSARGFVSPGASIMIPGFVTSTIPSQAPKRYLIRGVGPGLQQFGVGNALLNPTLTVVDSSGKTVVSNDDWEQNTNLADLRAVTAQLAFPLPAGSKDAAVLVSLAPGSYTCLVSGVGNTSGTALVEIYEVP